MSEGKEGIETCLLTFRFYLGFKDDEHTKQVPFEKIYDERKSSGKI